MEVRELRRAGRSGNGRRGGCGLDSGGRPLFAVPVNGPDLEGVERVAVQVQGCRWTCWIPGSDDAVCHGTVSGTGLLSAWRCSKPVRGASPDSAGARKYSWTRELLWTTALSSRTLLGAVVSPSGVPWAWEDAGPLVLPRMALSSKVWSTCQARLDRVCDVVVASLPGMSCPVRVPAGVGRGLVAVLVTRDGDVFGVGPAQDDLAGYAGGCRELGGRGQLRPGA